MVRPPMQMDEFTKEEYSKYCPFMACTPNCGFKGQTCAVREVLKRDHKTYEKKFDHTFVCNIYAKEG